MGGNRDFEQTRFRDGQLVREPPHRCKDGDGLIRPNRATGFNLAIKPGALELNQELRDAHDEYGDILTFATRVEAEAYAAQLSAADGELRVQAAAPNDPDDVDAYLLADHQPAVSVPAAVDGDTWTFDVGANLYGMLGEAVVTGGPTSPALEHFVDQDLADRTFEDGLRVRVTDGEFVSYRDGDGGSRWMPDCRVEARDGWRGRLIETYWCEIKTGDASFERTQTAAMRRLAEEERVLKVRVLIDDLSKQYAVRIHEVKPEE